ncbi:MAG: hypothetical protein IPJ22_13445 [Bacteroidetes bacterium]|nr:hypothetical protein [Bacteroidota bacterium]
MFASAKIKSKRILFLAAIRFVESKAFFISCSLVALFRLFGLLNLSRGKHSGSSGKAQENEYTATVDKIKQLEEREKNIRSSWL